MAQTVARAHLASLFGGLAPGGGTNDLGLCTIDPVVGITPQEFLVAVAAELLGERAGIGANFSRASMMHLDTRDFTP